MSRRAHRDAADGPDDLTAATQDLVVTIERLREEIETLRQAVDDLREEWTHELRQLRDALAIAEPKPYQLTSMPLNPCADDFEERVNAIDRSVFDAPDRHSASRPAQTVEEWVTPLLQQPAALMLTAEKWCDDQPLAVDFVIEIDATIYDWIAAYLVAAWEADEWAVGDDGLGSLFVLWLRDERCFVRRLTESQQQEFCRLTGVALNSAQNEVSAATTPSPDSAPETCKPSAAQQTLW